LSDEGIRRQSTEIGYPASVSCTCIGSARIAEHSGCSECVQQSNSPTVADLNVDPAHQLNGKRIVVAACST